MNEAHRRRIDRLDHEEQDRQDRKWGPDRHHPDGTGPDVAFAAAPEWTFAELRDLLIAATNARFAGLALPHEEEPTPGSWADILLEEVLEALAEESPRRLRYELVQSRAVMAQWIADLDRQLGDAPAEDRRRFTAAHVRVYIVLSGHEDATDSQIRRRYQAMALHRDWPMISGSGIRSRRAELVRWGLAERADRVGQSENGGKASSWRVRPLEALELAAAPQLMPAIDGEAVDQAILEATIDAGDDVIAIAHLQTLTAYLKAALS